MKRIRLTAACAVLAASPVVRAGEVALRLVDSEGHSWGLQDACDTPILTLEVRALATPTAGQGGLALFGFDFEAPSSVSLASSRFTTTLTSFVKSEGLTNPAGFGGTLSGNKLLQVGGGQNTIGYTGTSPSYPTGTVLAGVGLSETPIATIVLDTAWLDVGDYVFQISNGFANLIDPACQPSAPPYTVSAATMSLGSPTYLLMIGLGPPCLTIAGPWYSWKYHGASLGKLGLEIPQAPQSRAPIETREGSVTELTFSFYNAVDP